MRKWQLQDVKSRFSELINETLEKGSQAVTRRGIDTAVIVSIEEWRKLKDETPELEGRAPWGRSPVFDSPPQARQSEVPQGSGVRLIHHLIDTNVVAEVGKNKPHGAALAWMQDLELEQVFFSAVKFGEIQRGIELTRKQHPVKANEIEVWVAQLERSSKVLPMDSACFKEYARLMH